MSTINHCNATRTSCFCAKLVAVEEKPSQVVRTACLEPPGCGVRWHHAPQVWRMVVDGAQDLKARSCLGQETDLGSLPCVVRPVQA
jgi:hypothetical protein